MTVLRFCINERVNYLAKEFTEFPLVQDSLVHMDTIIDQALLRAADLPLEPPDPLTHLIALTLRFLPTELGWLGIRRYSGLAGEIACCLHGHTVLYEFAESYAPELLAGATEELWTPITLGAAENAVWTEVAGLSREDMDDDSLNPAPTFVQRCRLVSGVLSGLRGIISTLWLHKLGAFSGGAAVRPHQHSERGSRYQGRRCGVRVDALIQLLHSRGRLAESCLLKSNRNPRSGCWLAGPGGFLAGSTNLNPAEYRFALRPFTPIEISCVLERRMVSCAGAIGGSV